MRCRIYVENADLVDFLLVEQPYNVERIPNVGAIAEPDRFNEAASVVDKKNRDESFSHIKPWVAKALSSRIP